MPLVNPAEPAAPSTQQPPVGAPRRASRVHRDEGEDGAYADDERRHPHGSGDSANTELAPAEEEDVQSMPRAGNGNGMIARVPDDVEEEVEYDDGHGGEQNAMQSHPPEAGGYGDDDYGIPPASRKHSSIGNSDWVRDGRIRNGQAARLDQEVIPEEHPLTKGFQNLDPVEDVSRQKLESSVEQPADISTNVRGTETGGALSDAAKRRLIEYVAEFEGGQARYSSMNLDGEFKGRFGRDNPLYQRAHRGLSYGIAQFSQDSGNLGGVLTLMHERDPARFEEVFGPQWQELLTVTNASGPSSLKTESGRSARVQSVGEADLWEEPWVSRFREAGEHPLFQAAQNRLAAELFLDPVLPYAHWLGLYTERGLAMLYDLAVQLGLDQSLKFVVQTIGPVKTAAQRSMALQLLVGDGEETTLEAFQRQAGISADGDWNTETHAAMVGALRALFDAGTEIPIEIPGYEEMLDTLVAASATRSWGQRLERLRTDTQFSDQTYMR